VRRKHWHRNIPYQRISNCLPLTSRPDDAGSYAAAGGLAVGNVRGSWDLTSLNGYTKTGSADETRVRWTVGRRASFSPNRTVKLEYLYTALGTINYTSAYVPGSTFALPGSNYVERLSQGLTFHTVWAGVNYKFGGPVVAR
jgi:outer membrane immunogenic protein